MLRAPRRARVPRLDRQRARCHEFRTRKGECDPVDSLVTETDVIPCIVGPEVSTGDRGVLRWQRELTFLIFHSEAGILVLQFTIMSGHNHMPGLFWPMSVYCSLPILTSKLPLLVVLHLLTDRSTTFFTSSFSSPSRFRLSAGCV